MPDRSPPVWLLGLPFDLVTMEEARERIFHAADTREQLIFATPNVNFAAQAARDPRFREDVLRCDLCLVDGMPLVWLGRLLGIAFTTRVAGSDLLESLLTQPGRRALRVYFFGGEEGAAEAAARGVNRPGSGLVPAGAYYPGFVGIEQMSSEAIIQAINASGADFLVVALGAAKGHRWIEANRHRLEVPVISHLGAAINFLGDRVRRAPRWLQRIGLEWLWRIRQEPTLFRRYARDAVFLARVTLGFVLPEALRRRHRRQPTLHVTGLQDGSWFGTIEHGFEAATVASLPGGAVAGIELRNVKHMDCVAAGWLYASQYRVPQNATPPKLLCDAVSAATLRDWRMSIQTSR